VISRAAQAIKNADDSDLSGVVRDSSGAVIPSPLIVVRRDQSGLERVINGAADGTFSVRGLALGPYAITASAPGFEPATQIIELPYTERFVVTLSPAPIVVQVTVISASRQEELRTTLNTRVDVITRSRIEESGGHETRCA
jgi:Carboxypeptidase regulatory-like domain